MEAMNMKVGDSIGGLYEVEKDGVKRWALLEGKITKIVQNSRGTKVYSKRFYPLGIEEIEDNTKLISKADGWINTRDVVWLTPEIRFKCERWVEWANNNPDKAVGFLSGGRRSGMADLEETISRLQGEIYYAAYMGKDCVPVSLLQDALALLKAQGPVKPYMDYDGHDVWRCGNCGATIFHPEHTQSDDDAKNYAKFCRHCGKAVKWNGTD